MAAVRILVVEDQAIIADSIVDVLRELGYEVPAIASSAEDAARLACELQPDLVLVDIKLQGEMDGIDVASRIRTCLDAPIIYITAYSDEETLRRAKVTEPAAYLLKPFGPRDLCSAIEIALYKHGRDRELRESERQLQRVIEAVPDGVLLLDAERQLLLANPVGQSYLAFLAGVEPGQRVTRLGDFSIDELLEPLPEGSRFEIAVAPPVDRRFEVISQQVGDLDADQRWVLIIRDVTCESEMQRYLQQQERLAAVGQLAGGIAHDFNNVMAVITLYAQISLNIPDLPPKLYERLRIINEEALRASALIQQILDFSRRRKSDRRPVDLRVFLKEQVKLLRHTLPENIGIDLLYADDEYAIVGDLTRMQQAFINLVAYARDRMPDGGAVRIEIDRLTLAASGAPPLPEMEPGDWVRVQVADTGGDLAPEVLAHIFDPSFADDDDHTSGWCLAQVNGIVASHGGYTRAISSSERGLTFQIYLPALPVETPAVKESKPAPLARGQGELILLVEDNPAAREALANALDYLGYAVVQATNGREALAIFEQRAGEVQLVLSDVVMPEMGGVALLQALREHDASVRVVMISGHPLKKKLDEMIDQGLTDWLAKPPDLEQLAKALANALRED
jgi:CheY-like chemotaxis protein